MSRSNGGRPGPVRALLTAVLLLLPVTASLPATTSGFTSTTTNALSTFQTGAFCPTAPAEPFWLTGMEHGVTKASAGGGLWQTTHVQGSSPAVETTVVRSGSRALKIHDVSTAETSAASAAVANAGVVVARFAVRFETLPAANVERVAGTSVNAGNSTYLGFDAANKKFRMKLGTSNALSSAVVSVGTWYLIEFRSTTGTNPRTTEWRVDGVEQTTLSLAETASTTKEFRFGGLLSGDVYTAYYDDMMLSSTGANYPLGDGRILGAGVDSYVGKADTAGYLQDDAGAAVGSTTWQRLDDSPMTSLSDFVKQTTASTSAYAEFGFSDPASTACPRYVSAVVTAHSSSTTSNQAKTSIMDAGTEKVVYDTSVAPGSSVAAHRAKVIPPGTDGWTAERVSALTTRIGMAASVGSVPYWDALQLEYDTP